MSAKLLQNPDGANFQARAVLEMVRYNLGDGIEESWNEKSKRYDAEPMFTRFDNCREQGYQKQINITFYEHRNSDSIYVQVNNTRTGNAPTLNDITSTWQGKWECALCANPGEIAKVARFVTDKIEEFWEQNHPKQPAA